MTQEYKNKFSLQKKPTESQKGNMIMMAVVGAAICSVVGLAFASMMSSMSASMGYMEDKQSAYELKNTLLMDLSDPNSCVNTLGGRGIASSQALSVVRDKTNSSVLSSSSSYDRLNVGGLSLINTSVSGGPNRSGRMVVRVPVTRQRTKGGPSELRPIDVTVFVRTDASARISSCKGVADGSVDPTASEDCVGSPISASWFGSGSGASSVRHAHGTVVVGKNTVMGHSSGTDDTFESRYLCIDGKWALTGKTMTGSTSSSKGD